MDRRERFNDMPTALLAALQGWQSGMWTALPCIVQSFNAAAMTIVARSAIRGVVRNPQGSEYELEMPLLLDVPVIFPSGGGFTLTFPITEGDECLVVFASRCIDSWWQLSGVQGQAEFRMHDLSDGFAFVGPRSQPRAVSGISTTAVQLRTDTGETFVEVDNAHIRATPDGGTTLIDAIPGKIRLTAAQIEVHASESYKWDVNGYGEKISYMGGDEWQIDTYKTPVFPPQVVTTIPHDIEPPEIP